MTRPSGEYRLYSELADWWPLISPPQEYAVDATILTAVFNSAAIAVHEVLDLGSGGGHNAVHLKKHLTPTLVDLSEEMLAVSRRMNPECEHIRGDMLTLRLDREFDAVLVHDAIDYVIGDPSLRQVVATAFAHCRPGGIAVFVPDYTAETFEPGSGSGGSGDGAGREGSFRQWLTDPDPADDWILAEYEFMLRAADGTVRIVREAHKLAAFSRDTWLRTLAEAGFAPVIGSGPEPSLFIGHRPR